MEKEGAAAGWYLRLGVGGCSEDTGCSSNPQSPTLPFSGSTLSRAWFGPEGVAFCKLVVHVAQHRVVGLNDKTACSLKVVCRIAHQSLSADCAFQVVGINQAQMSLELAASLERPCCSGCSLS